MILPKNKPLMAKWAIWCWHKPRYIGVPLSLGIFILVFVDGIYPLYLLIKYWGKEEKGK